MSWALPKFLPGKCAHLLVRVLDPAEAHFCMDPKQEAGKRVQFPFLPWPRINLAYMKNLPSIVHTRITQ
eukprot:816555-Pelagomonas_calceolata.AAC.4